MPDWTKTNFDELADRSPRDVPMSWKFARDAMQSDEIGVSRFTYEPGARMPFGHSHREQEEAYVVVAGSGRAKLDDEIIELAAWDVLRVAPAVIRSFEAGRTGSTSSALAAAGPRAATTSLGRCCPTSRDMRQIQRQASRWRSLVRVPSYRVRMVSEADRTLIGAQITRGP